MNRTFAFILLVLTIGSCEDPVKFESPQPPNQSDLKQIPKQLRGSYQSTSDSTNLTINERTIIDWTEIQFRSLRDSLDIEIDSTKIINKTTDYIEVLDGSYNLEFKFFGDSVLVDYSYRDTLFEISDMHILRRFKGHYFLNYKRSETNWKVRRLTLNKKRLSFSKVQIPEDIETLKEITEIKEIKSDSSRVTGYKLNPSRKELKKLMKLSFSETKTYKKVE
ncbi:MAG: hypothetical protein RIM99_19565 [Cyclobacteriaceae bacterium]